MLQALPRAPEISRNRKCAPIKRQTLLEMNFELFQQLVGLIGFDFQLFFSIGYWEKDKNGLFMTVQQNSAIYPNYITSNRNDVIIVFIVSVVLMHSQQTMNGILETEKGRGGKGRGVARRKGSQFC